MKILFISLLALAACSYKITDDARVNDVIARQNMMEQKQEALESRVNAQGEELNRLRRGLIYK